MPKSIPSQRAAPSRPKRRPKAGHRDLYLRVGAFFAIFVVVAAVAFVLVQPLQTDDVPGAVSVQIDMSGFKPATLEAKVGVPVTVQLINPDSPYHTDGDGWHQFALPELNVDARVSPKSKKVITFTPTTPGTYTFYCDICCGGKENPTMQGTLKVTA